ncbi:hypothetical protein KDA11_05010 [Candidatus Saccharibacteria bacterium]|nr:hypothetical protein [Candidatus Saccharibacteria bacterium]
MLPIGVKVVIAIIVVLMVMAAIWIIVWAIRKGPPAPPPLPLPEPNPPAPPPVSPPNPSTYTKASYSIGIPCIGDDQCGAAYNPKDGVGWVLDNRTSQNIGINGLVGTNCDTTPGCSQMLPLIKMNNPCPPGQTKQWTEGINSYPLVPGAVVYIMPTTGRYARATIPQKLNPATHYVRFIVRENTQGITALSVPQPY